MTAAAGPFTIRELLSSLPRDPAFLFVHIANVASPMSHADVCELVGAKNVVWQYCCENHRTDFIVQLPSLEHARRVVASVDKHVKFSGQVLTAAFVDGFKVIPADMSNLKQFASEPKLFYTLPPAAEYDKKVSDAKAIIAKLEPTRRTMWVEKR